MLALPPMAWGQSDVGAPVQLPPVDETETEGPPGPNGRQVPTRPGAQDLGIEVGVISSRAPTVGTLTGGSGLGTDIWAETSLTRAQILLNQIPVEAPSHAMKVLTQRLLLTASGPPEYERGGDGLIRLRLERALAAGLIDAVPTLIDQATHLDGDAEIEILRAETILLRGGAMEGCGNATSFRLEREEPFWMKLRAYCFAQQGFVPAARLTADLLYEIGDEDELFQALLERQTGNLIASLDGLMEVPLSAIHLVMMRDLGLVPPAAALSDIPLSVARVMALDPGWAGEDGLSFRLAMAERAARAGALSAPELLSAYEAISPFEPTDRTAQLSAAARTNTGNARALFAEALASDTIPGTRAETMVAALGPAAATEMGPAYAAALGFASRDVLPEEVLTWASRAFAVTALAARNREAAYDWFDIYARGGKPSQAAAQSLRAAMIMVGPSERYAFWAGQSLEWLAEADLGNISHERLTAQLILFEAMGYTLPPEVRERLATFEGGLSGEMPPPAVISNLREAATAGRIGEVAGYALVALGEGGPRAAHPYAVGEAVLALRVAGLEADARAIAAEVLLGFALEDVE
jgi:hypothetical protein